MTKVTFPATIILETDRYSEYGSSAKNWGGQSRSTYATGDLLTFDKIKDIISERKIKVEIVNSWLNYEQKPTIIIRDYEKKDK